MPQEILTIYTDAGLSAEDIGKMPRYLAGIEDFYATPAFDKLFEHLCFNGEMPYEVAKARTETPDEWILDYIIKGT